MSTIKYVIIGIISSLWTLIAMFFVYCEFYGYTGPLFPAQLSTFNHSLTPHHAVSLKCSLITRRQTRPRTPRKNPKTPPWLTLLQDYPATVRYGKNLYVSADPRAARFRLGNMLFNYAATFGIAWRNGRIPLWPEKPPNKNNHDIARLFSLRVPLDHNGTNGTITSVSAKARFPVSVNTLCLK